MKTLIFLFIVSCFLFFNSAQAANPFDVVINEIAWMGTENSYNDEWIELYNNTDSSINLEGWILKAADGTPEIKLARTVLANGFYLLERTDDNTIAGIAADQIYVGSLKNGGEILELYDRLGNLIDSVDCSAGWFAGDNSTKQTMERINSLAVSDTANWGTSQNPGGTPKAENSVDMVTEPPPPPPPEESSFAKASEDKPEPLPAEAPSEAKAGEPEPPSQEEPQPEPQSIAYPSGILINEVLPSPTGPDAEEEWIEIFNQNDFEVNVSFWKISDTAGKTNIYTFPGETIIDPQEFLILSRPTTKITLNNSGDGLLLIQPNGNILDTVNYEKAPRGQSYNRIPLEEQTESGWTWSAILTPGSANIVPSPTLETGGTKPSKENIEEPTPSQEPQEAQRQLAAIGEQIPESSKSSLVLLIALPLAVFSGIVILTLKRKLKLG